MERFIKLPTTKNNYSPNKRLTDQQIAAIRNSNKTIEQIREEFGISKSYAYKLKNSK